MFVEKATGDQTAPVVEAEFGGVAKDQRLNDYMNFVGRRLLPYSKRRDTAYKFQALESTEIPNAFALGNGNVYVTRGLLTMLDDEAELAEIMGHEIGHVDNRHIASNIDVAIGTTGLLALATGIYSASKNDKIPEGSQALIDAANALIPSLVMNGFSRDHEFDADSRGLAYMTGAGYDPSAAVRVFQKFQKLEGPQKNAIEIFFRSHPYALDRVKAIQTAIVKKNLPAGEAFQSRYRSIVYGGGTVNDTGILGMSTPVAIGVAAALAISTGVVIIFL